MVLGVKSQPGLSMSHIPSWETRESEQHTETTAGACPASTAAK
jgi:hypothetical protein